jgi:hypothetical protein
MVACSTIALNKIILMTHKKPITIAVSGLNNIDSPGPGIPVIRALKEKKPKYFLFENVFAMNQDKFRPFLREIRNDLHNQGYQVFYHTLNSLSYGTPQSRERVWFIGYRKDLAKPFGWTPYPKEQGLIKTFQELKVLIVLLIFQNQILLLNLLL